MELRWPSLVFALFLSSCTTLVYEELPRDVPQTYFGFVRIKGAEPTSAVRSRRASTAGLWLGAHGTGAGWRHDGWVTVADDCEVIVLVKNEAQLQSAVRLLSSTDGWEEGSLCVGY